MIITVDHIAAAGRAAAARGLPGIPPDIVEAMLRAAVLPRAVRVFARGEAGGAAVRGKDIRAAREVLGHRWGLGRPLTRGEMGRALGLGGNDPSLTISQFERERKQISGTVAMLVRLYLKHSPERARAPIISTLEDALELSLPGDW